LFIKFTRPHTHTNTHYIHTCTHTHTGLLCRRALSRILMCSGRPARCTNCFYPFTLSTLRLLPSPFLPISPSPMIADRYPLKTPDCTDNLLQSRRTQIPSEKTTQFPFSFRLTDLTDNLLLKLGEKLTATLFSLLLSLSQPKTQVVFQTRVRMEEPVW